MNYFHLGASADADRVLSPSATEPVVSAHSGNAPLRVSLSEALLAAADRADYRASNGCEYSLQDANAIDEALDVIRALKDAVEYAHSEGFEWPSDPIPASLREA